MAKDSQVWAEAYAASKRVIKVPNYKKIKPERVPRERTESMVLMHELYDIKTQIASLKVRSREIRKKLAGQKIIKGDYYNRPIKLYALRLENACWYIGMSRNPDKRFKRHGTKKGAMWTQLHKPLELVEVRDTGSTDDKAANLMEDDMTLEYALKYGSDKVRGGGYCQRKPRWPDVILQNEIVH